MSRLVRTIPEQLQETGEYEMRIMMPRYGTISERRNRLHEVIRLSGTNIPMEHGSETLKVKVASIPGIRLQVYFMDNNRYFKRKGLLADKDGQAFEDNAERALFFGRAALETIRCLGWGPDIVHAFGCMSGFVPMLLRTEFGSEGLFEKVKVVYTPDELGLSVRPSASMVDKLSLDRAAAQHDLSTLGGLFADGVIYPPNAGDVPAGAARFSTETDEMTQQAISLYDQILNGVPA